MLEDYLNIESDDDLLKILEKSVFLTDREIGDVTMSLYYYHDFFIETFYNNSLRMFVVISGFKDVKQLDHHLTTIDIDNLS